MPRVHTRTANKAAVKVRRCTAGGACKFADEGGTIQPGQRFYTWTRRFGRSGQTYYRHVDCGRPRPTELSGRKTAQIEEAAMDTSSAISSWAPELPAEFEPGDSLDIETGDLTSALAELASVAESVADEYEESYNALPENFQAGPTGEAMETVAEELRDWASERESWEPSEETSVEVEERQDDESVEDWRQRIQDAWDSAVETLRSEAEGQAEGWPEYEG